MTKNIFDLINPGYTKSYKRKIFLPFKPLPNVDKLTIVLSPWDRLLLDFGFQRRRNKAQLIVTPYKNKFLNRYLFHQFSRLHWSKSPTHYWRIGMHLLVRSRVFFVLGLNHICFNWQRDYNLKDIFRIMREYYFFCDNPDIITSTRMYILKSGGRIRPIGYPKPSLRIYLHLLNQLLCKYLFTYKHVKSNQHGFLPNRGTLSCWREILSKVITSKDIYEFDLNSFFNSVNHTFLKKSLTKINIPTNIVNMIMNLHRREKYTPNLIVNFNSGPFNKNTVDLEPRSELIESNVEIYNSLVSHFGIEEVKQFKTYFDLNVPLTVNSSSTIKWWEDILSWSPLLDFSTPKDFLTEDELYTSHLESGVPQGYPTSPLLATLCLNDTLLTTPSEYDSIMYADDGLFYGNLDNLNTQETPLESESHITYSKDKCHWVKKDNKWLKPLVFLGLQFDGTTLSGHTHKGSLLIYDKQEMIDTYLKEYYYDDWRTIKNENSWNKLIKSKLLGLIQSRLYLGYWTSDCIVQDFNLTYKSSSFCDKFIKSFNLDIYNSSSYANYWLVRHPKKIKRNKNSNIDK